MKQKITHTALLLMAATFSLSSWAADDKPWQSEADKQRLEKCHKKFEQSGFGAILFNDNPEEERKIKERWAKEKQNMQAQYSKYQAAAQKGDTQAQFLVAKAQDYLDKDDKGEAYYTAAAEKGHVEAMNKLRVRYGDTRFANTQKYVYWAEKLSKIKGKQQAAVMYDLGEHYRKGSVVGQNWEVARQWYEQAVALKHPYAAYELGEIYAFSKGVKQDLPTAKQWYAKANQWDECGNENAQKRLYELKKMGY